MKSQYLDSAEDLEVGDFVFPDGDFEPVEIMWLGQIYARVKDIETGHEWELMRNRLKLLPVSNGLE
jgi:hypothetical protein